eukprot:scaffold70210_cov63-Phaeocystis_antarctica.AAC.2
MPGAAGSAASEAAAPPPASRSTLAEPPCTRAMRARHATPLPAACPPPAPQSSAYARLPSGRAPRPSTRAPLDGCAAAAPSAAPVRPPPVPPLPPRAPHAANREARRVAAPPPPGYNPARKGCSRTANWRSLPQATNLGSRASTPPPATAPPTAPTRATARGAASAEALSTSCPADAARSSTPRRFPTSSRRPEPSCRAQGTTDPCVVTALMPRAPLPSPPTSSTPQTDCG